MQESKNRVEEEKPVRTVWRVVDLEETVYVARCSSCGYRKKELREHWFFTGMYCLSCIVDILWDNCRTFEEMGE